MKVKSQYNLGPNPLLTKVLDIGIWNMDLTPSVTVAHGLTIANIRTVGATIIADSGTVVYSLSYSNAPLNSDGNISWDATDIVLVLRVGGFFDGVAFDDGAMNRGYVIIGYVA